MKTSFEMCLQEMADQVTSQKERLARQRFDADMNTYSAHVNDSLKDWRENLVSIFAQSIFDSLDKTYRNLMQWGSEGVRLLVHLDLPLELAVEEVRFYRDTIGEIIKNSAMEAKLSIPEFYEIISRFDSVVDRAVHWLSISYSTTYAARISAAELTSLELSIPVVRITENIGVLPLIGDIDTKRSQELMEKALKKGTSYGLSHIIIDLSGVPIIDTMVADHIFKVIDALKLIGIESILTGIRPEIAQTMISLGIKAGGVITFGSLHNAVKYLQAKV
ncbi:STAS domain-containing protein [Bacillus sp. B-jedd]|uniref:STAS domain-containing protein n=1 Tax=Bacillus sp. B-jedd TaxID=1476857 RepID=UPI0005155D57|nr:STAS domain-containing protein [Bacillus sp. B-jedd]CEG26270.1 anti-sigma-factor antagonist [Bacillus sp. B-jedd]